MEKGDEDGFCVYEGDLVVGGFVDGQYEVSFLCFFWFDNFCFGFFICVVRLSSMFVSFGFDDYFVVEFEQGGNSCWSCGDLIFIWE